MEISVVADSNTGLNHQTTALITLQFVVVTGLILCSRDLSDQRCLGIYLKSKSGLMYKYVLRNPTDVATISDDLELS